jgi:hypothetical protein
MHPEDATHLPKCQSAISWVFFSTENAVVRSKMRSNDGEEDKTISVIGVALFRDGAEQFGIFSTFVVLSGTEINKIK